eukprot:TRINITY_DN3774_c0_g1_i1.p1 TRINITY_DN3774_c0_g1~~TRINITY_DN3774_c0_g1_i1.p1  ORF type:complete len:747 (+),score=308.44 TRINITY_DN3774_c0_g1_i1:1861-4101(+)
MPSLSTLRHHRERCLYSVVGWTTAEQRLVVHDSHFNNNPVDLPMETLFGKPPRMHKEVKSHTPAPGALSLQATPDEALNRVLANPTVSCKNFLVTIGDRSVTGLVARDQMVGRWQVPLADVAVTASGYDAFTGEAMALGERTPVAIISGPASAGLAVGEALTNILASDVATLKDVRFSANWMVNSGSSEEDYNLFKTVEKIGMDLAPKLGIAIPVGKDSMSMKSIWTDEDGKDKKVAAPLSVVITAFAPVQDVRNTITPDLKAVKGESQIILVDLAKGKTRLGGSVVGQCYNSIGDEAPGMEDPALFVAFAKAMSELRGKKKVLAYHDRSDGGLIAAMCEMAFAGRLGFEMDLGDMTSQAKVVEHLFNEELGVALQVRKADADNVIAAFVDAGMPAADVKVVATVTSAPLVHVKSSLGTHISRTRTDLHRIWSATSYELQAQRDNPKCAKEEYDALLDEADTGLFSKLTFQIPKPLAPSTTAPKVAILREQGVNGHVEMAWAFRCAGFNTFDVHMSDVLGGKVSLGDFRGLVCCGGFSYGDCLGAGRGWANTIKRNKTAALEFKQFFERKDTFSLGICNGCQMLGSLWDLIPGAGAWPKFTYNESTQFEARVSLVKVEGDNKSIFFKDMAGSVFPVAVSHGEGRAEFRGEGDQAQCAVPLRYADYKGQETQVFPANPNGSPNAIAGVTSADGRATALMPHPERILRTSCSSWSPDSEPEPTSAPWGDYTPWLKFFNNARQWCDANQ